MIDVMLDLETMGRSRGAAVASVALVLFDLETGEADLDGALYRVVDLSSATTDLGLRCDGSTVAWWLEQDDAARRALLGGDAIIPVLRHVEGWFAQRLAEGGRGPLNVWAKDPDFDLEILAGAFYAWRRTDPPWHYNAGRSVRTIEDLAGRLGWQQASVPRDPELAPHHALDDALYQIHRVCGAWRHVRVLR